MMSIELTFKTANTILYCQRWRETVDFYRAGLELSVSFESDWFVEFRLVDAAHLSIADERRACINSVAGQGITLALQVEDADAAWRHLQNKGLQPGPVRDHAWGARVFYFFDPEGHRLEIWSPHSR